MGLWGVVCTPIVAVTGTGGSVKMKPYWITIDLHTIQSTSIWIWIQLYQQSYNGGTGGPLRESNGVRLRAARRELGGTGGTVCLPSLLMGLSLTCSGGASGVGPGSTVVSSLSSLYAERIASGGVRRGSGGGQEGVRRGGQPVKSNESRIR
eukprot:1178213-Prorocentrum_minimum.AAC.2